MASFPFFNAINTDGFSKENIVQAIQQENLNSFRYKISWTYYRNILQIKS